MKMHPEHLAFLKNAIAPKDTPARRAAYQGLTSKRYRWDLLWSSALSIWVSDNLYPYLNDTHIDTALRTIVKDLA